MTGHQKRVLTGLTAIVVVLSIVLLGTRELIAGFVFVLSSIGLWEFYNMFWNTGQKLGWKVLGLILSLPIIAAPLLGWEMVSIILICFWLLSLIFLFITGFGERADWEDQQVLFFGLIYIPVILQIFVSLSPVEMVFVLLVAMVSDTGAYYIGTYFGQRKIWPQISPNKSWAGALGGLVLTVLIALIFGSIWGKLEWQDWIWVAVILNIAAQFGDFFESGLKRMLKKKDAGRLLPGHGGLLDRIDSLLLVLPVYIWFANFIQFF